MESGFLYNFLRFIYFVVVFAIVIALAFYTTKFIAKRASPKGRTRNMKMLETLPIGPDKTLVLVKVGERNFLFTNMQKSLSCIAEINSEDLITEIPLEFEEILNNERSEYGEIAKESIQKNLVRLKKMFKGNIKDE